MFHPPFLYDVVLATMMLDILKLSISLPCPASWSLCNNYHFVTSAHNKKCILHPEIQVCQAANLCLLCNAKKGALGIRSEAEGLRIILTGANPKQDLSSEKVPSLRAPNQSVWGIPLLVAGFGCLLSDWELCMSVWTCCPLLSKAPVSFRVPYKAFAYMIHSLFICLSQLIWVLRS